MTRSRQGFMVCWDWTATRVSPETRERLTKMSPAMLANLIRDLMEAAVAMYPTDSHGNPVWSPGWSFRVLQKGSLVLLAMEDDGRRNSGTNTKTNAPPPVEDELDGDG